jgi:hypothetical protein
MRGKSPHTNRRGVALRPAVIAKEGPVTDRREERDGERRERRQAEEDEERLKEERDRRSDELREAWRRHHPSEEEEDGKGRPGRGREGAEGA